MTYRLATFTALLPLLITQLVHAQEPEAADSVDQSPRHNILWDVSNGGGIVENYAKVTLGLSKRVSANASLTQASDGTQGYSAGINRNFEKGWLGVNYKTISVSNDVSTQSLALYTGRVSGNWDFSFTPSYTRTSVYGQKGGKQSNTIGAPGISAGVSHRGKNMDLGIDSGMNFYSGRLDSYISDSRMIGMIGLQSQLTTTGLEKSYWSVYMRRYQSWGDWGLDYLDSVSAVDLSHSQSTAARVVYYLGKQWDLRLALIQSVYSGAAQNSVTVGAKYYW
jgi:hypothetical protein